MRYCFEAKHEPDDYDGDMLVLWWGLESQGLEHRCFIPVEQVPEVIELLTKGHATATAPPAKFEPSIKHMRDEPC